MLLGLLHPTRGESSLLGCDSQRLTPALRAGIGYLSEGHHLYGWMTVRAHAEFMRPFYETWNQEWFEGTLERYRLDPKKRIRTLSRGQRAQVALALCLAPQPELLILDDPTLGLDPVVRLDVLESIVETLHEQKRTVFFSSHNLADVERLADRIGILENGVLRADCRVETFKAQVRRVRCRFPNGRPSEPLNVVGLLRARWRENEAILTLARFEEQRIEELRSLGADDLELVDASLEELFVDYTMPLSGRS
jgi:ABC-2 type transport system ATP-binding protein